MLIVCLLDVSVLIHALGVPAVMSFFGLTHCNSGEWIIRLGFTSMYMWYLYTAASVILGLNRLIEFSSPRLTGIFFSDKRTWAWLLVIFGYSTFYSILIPEPYYYYNPMSGTWIIVLRTPEKANYAYIANNLSKLVIIGILYFAMIYVLRTKLRLNEAISNVQKRLSLQCFTIAILSAAANVSYLGISYLFAHKSIYIGMVVELLWGLLHGVSGYIYFVMNRPVQKTVKKFIGIAKFRKTTVMHITVSNNGFKANKSSTGNVAIFGFYLPPSVISLRIRSNTILASETTLKKIITFNRNT
ncbi:hypothetical protein L596_012131 [Steinernema carpocapsae]|uniref:7TM GPCR serpentine receptor class x (Srx) domain-containing protein n=1 Tax=Steinernema carpocapsae TaxID=34508 RepID=A0A4U5NX11_STECR|nr:hypothetical protein L596_012131 [Steinernema carpocapsae]